MYMNEQQQFTDETYGFQSNSQIFIVEAQDPYMNLNNNMNVQNIQNISPMNQHRQPNYINYQMPPQVNKTMINGYKPNMPMNNSMMNMTMQRQSGNYLMQPQTNQWQNNNYPPHMYEKPIVQKPSLLNESKSLLIQQFKITINMIKHQNKQTLERLQRQNQKITNNFQYIKSLIQKGQLIVQKKQYNQEEIIAASSQALGESQNISSMNVQNNSVNNYKGTEAQRQILKRKILMLHQKKNKQNLIKLENQQNPSPNNQNQTNNNKNQSSNLHHHQNHNKSATQKNFDNKNSQPLLTQDQQRPQYPQDFSGQQSYLVDQQVQKKQKQINQKKNITDPTKVQFGISEYQVEKQKDYSFKSKFTPKNQQEVKKQVALIQNFLDTFLCQKIQYAPKKLFNMFKLARLQLYQIYFKWKHSQAKNRDNLPKVQPKIIQMRLSGEFKKRFASCASDRNSYIGVKFKDSQEMSRLLIKR